MGICKKRWEYVKKDGSIHKKRKKDGSINNQRRLKKYVLFKAAEYPL